MKNRKAFKKYIIDKSNNHKPIRVLYKKSGMLPQIKIIEDVSKLKKFIVKRNLDIIPYEDVFLICNNQKLLKNVKPNVVFIFSHISGDLILVKIDKIKREFKGVSQEEALFYSIDLANKSYRNIVTKNNKKKEENILKNDNNNFESTMMSSIANIELALIALLKK